jgi:hypothetical protein
MHTNVFIVTATLRHRGKKGPRRKKIGGLEKASRATDRVKKKKRTKWVPENRFVEESNRGNQRGFLFKTFFRRMTKEEGG